MTNKEEQTKSSPLLEVQNLKMYFPLQVNLLGKARAHLRAVDDVSFQLHAGQTIGVVGESGCGKTTLGRTILKLYEATGGRAVYYGKSIDDFLPKYYVQGIKRLPLNSKIIAYYQIQVQKLSEEIEQTSALIETLKSSIDPALGEDYPALLDLCKQCQLKITLQNKLDGELKETTRQQYQERLDVLKATLADNTVLLGYDEQKLDVVIVNLKQLVSNVRKLAELQNKKQRSEKKIEEKYVNCSYSTGGCILSSQPKELKQGLFKLITLQKKRNLLEEKQKRSHEHYVNKMTSLEQIKKDIQQKLDAASAEEQDKLKARLEAKNQATEHTKQAYEVRQDNLKTMLELLQAELEETKKLITELKKTIPQNDFYNQLEKNRDKGLNLIALTKKEMRSLRTDIQLIFQDPYSSLPPRMTVGAIIAEAVKVHHIVPKKEVHEYVLGIMEKCGLQPQYYDRYPHEFSGGQRQRICIARALAVKPRLVICDEPVSALDVSIQAQIINLLKELQTTMGLTYVFISHDLSVVKYITDDVMVMYLGNVMEIGKTTDIFDTPLHPYTEALFSAVPVPNPNTKMNRIILKGDIPSPANPPKGCKFHTRCNKCMGICKALEPKFLDRGNHHFVSCHLYDDEIMNNRLDLEKQYETVIVEQDLKEGSQEIEEK